MKIRLERKNEHEFIATLDGQGFVLKADTHREAVDTVFDIVETHYQS